MDLYNPHSLLDEALEEAPERPGTEGDEVVLSKLLSAKPESADDMDLEKVVVTVVLFLLAYFVLAPRSPSRRLKRRSESKERITVMPGSPAIEQGVKAIDATSINSSNTSPPATLCTEMVLHLMEEEEETEEEKFLQMYPIIRKSPYRRLVLPPECKLVDKPKHLLPTAALLQSSKEKPETVTGKSNMEDDEDHPARRLKFYLSQLFNLIRSIFVYDYVGALSTVIRWLMSVLKLRRDRQNSPIKEEEDDDASRSSIVTANSKQCTAEPNSPPFRTPMSGMEVDSPLEEIKDAEGDRLQLLRQMSGDSVYEVALNETGENHVGEKKIVPPPPAVPRLSAKPKGGAKRKDALENYRGAPSQNGGFLGQATLAPRAQQLPAPHHDRVSFDVPPDVPERISEGSVGRVRSDSDHSMSYFDATHSRDVLKQMSMFVSLPDRNGYILGDEFLPNSKYTPLLVFVNSRAGPQQGQLLITQLRRLLNPIQVWDLADGGPEKVLESFCVMSRLRILVCGGDGTVSWIISALEKMKIERWPPIAILPLGTGNDLARIHGWGGGYTNDSLIAILEQVADSYISLLDRWEMTVENKKGKIQEAKAFTNYLGVGVDAQAALQVHMLRESMPQFFFSRAVNKAWYGLFGAEDAIKATHANLPHEVILIADGVEVPLPADSQGIILLNIDSYAGGIPMWSHAAKPGAGRGDMFYWHPPEKSHRRSLDSDNDSLRIMDYTRSSQSTMGMDRVDSLDDLGSLLTDEEKLDSVTSCDMPSSCQDGMLDIVSIRGAFHLGQIRVGLSHAQRLCQCREATVIIKRKTAVHIDGEPWRQTVATLHVKRKKEPAIMLHRSPDESGGVETEVGKLLDWAEERHIIDRNVHSTLMKEFSRRIETKTRQKRVRSQENLMLSLSRAIGRTNSLPTNYQKAYPSSISF